MSLLLRIIAVFGAVGVILLGAQGAAADVVLQNGGANNIVTVSTTGQGMTLARSSTQVSSVSGPSVGSTNIADAEATNCTGCHSTAVAVQTVFVVGSPQFYTPGNSAVAANGGCSYCVSFAYAWQYVVQVPGPVHLSPAGQAAINGLRQRISDAASTPINSLADATAVCNTLNALTSQLKLDVDSDLLASGVLATGTPNENVDVTSGDLVNPPACS